MKPKKVEKKLVLSKITISNLNLDEMLTIRAGLALASGQETCQTQCPTCRSDCPTHCFSIDVTCVTKCPPCKD